jgi:hypothetical protein
MCPFPTPPLLEKRCPYELDAALRCPFYIAARIIVTEGKNQYESKWLMVHKNDKFFSFVFS